MGKQKGGYYAVRTGRIPGIYSSWAAAEEQIKGGRYSTRFPPDRLTTAQALPGRNTKSLAVKKRPDRTWMWYSVMHAKYLPLRRI